MEKNEKKVTVTLRFTEQDRAALRRAAQLKGKTVQQLLLAYSKKFENRVRRQLAKVNMKFEY